MNIEDYFVPKRQENLGPSFFETPHVFKHKDDYTEDSIQEKARETTIPKYNSDKPMSNVEYTNHGIVTSALRGVQETDNFYSRLFFSRENIEYIQKRIRSDVHTKSKFIIGRQDETELILVMRSMHIQYSRNPDDKYTQLIKSEISRIDDMVINFSVPRIISEVRQYFQYITDSSRLPVPLEHPKLLTNSGTKSLNPSLNIPFDRNTS